MKRTAFAMQFSISSLRCPGYNFLNDVSAWIHADVHSTYLQSGTTLLQQENKGNKRNFQSKF